MAHHLGMSLLALTNFLDDNVMRRRFHSDPYVKAADLLLQERLPRHLSVMERKEDVAVPTAPRDTGPLVTRRFTLADLDEIDVFPGIQWRLFSHAHHIRFGVQPVGRHARPAGADPIKDRWGCSSHQRSEDRPSSSAGYQPTLTKPDGYEVEFADDRAEYIRWDDGIKTRMEVTVSSEQREVRRLS